MSFGTLAGLRLARGRERVAVGIPLGAEVQPQSSGFTINAN